MECFFSPALLARVSKTVKSLPEQVAGEEEEPGGLDQVEHPEDEPAAQAHGQHPCQERLLARLCRGVAHERSGQHGGQVGNAEHETVLKSNQVRLF